MANNSTDDNLIKIEPVEYHPNMGPHRNPRILRYRKLCCCIPITLDDLKEKIKTTKLKKRVNLTQLSDGRISYQYKGMPQIILDTTTISTYVTEETFERFGERMCQQQASIVLRLLKGYLYIHFIRKSNTLNPDKIGKTAEDRDITYRAFKYLMNDPLH